MCLWPTLIRNKKYLPNAKNGGIVPPFHDTRVLHVAVGCGKCIECRKQKANSWRIRLLEDIKTNTNGKFVTLTFSNESIKELTEICQAKNTEISGYALDNEIATLGMRRFNERWRKKYKKAIRHWTVTELGHNGTENIHLHGILWTNESFDTIRAKWHYGYIYPRPDQYKYNFVNERTINYSIKYIHKTDKDHPNYRSIVLTTPGIGKNYITSHDSKLNKFNESETKTTYTTRTGHKIALPIYWRNKIYTEEEREALWLHQLDKEERYILGNKIDVSETDQHYYEALEYWRRHNKELGYGDNKRNWKKEHYEHERRKIIQATRIKNAKSK